MMDETIFYTRTMAKILADQGNLEEAAKIYRFLLEKEPGGADLQLRLEEIQDRLKQDRNARMIDLFQQWIDLMLTYRRIHLLQKLKLTKPTRSTGQTKGNV